MTHTHMDERTRVRTSRKLHELNIWLFTLNVSASTGWANANRGRATFTKELRNFFSIRVFSDSEITDFSRLFNIFSVAIFIISNDARPATKVVVVARAGTIRPAICRSEEEEVEICLLILKLNFIWKITLNLTLNNLHWCDVMRCDAGVECTDWRKWTDLKYRRLECLLSFIL